MFQGIYFGLKETCGKYEFNKQMVTYKTKVLKQDAQKSDNRNEKQAKAIISTITTQDVKSSDLAPETKTQDSCALWEGTVMGWRKVSTFKTCPEARRFGNMYYGIFLGIIEECFDQPVIPKMAAYLINLRDQINGMFNCKWFDCKTKCFMSPEGEKTKTYQCVSGLDLSTEKKTCRQL